MEKISNFSDSLSKLPGIHYNLDDFNIIVHPNAGHTFVFTQIHKWSKSVADDLYLALLSLHEEHGEVLYTVAPTPESKRLAIWFGFLPTEKEHIYVHHL